MSKKFWWSNRDARDGIYRFCFNNKGQFTYWIEEVGIAYRFPITKFGGVKFVWCGDDARQNPLKAETIEEAKIEFEQIYRKILSDRIRALNNAKRQAIEDQEDLLWYLEHRAEQKESPRIEPPTEVDIQETIKEIDRLFINYGRNTDVFTVNYNKDTDHLYCYYVPYINNTGYVVWNDFLWVEETSKKDLQTLKDYLDKNKIRSIQGCEWKVNWGYSEE